MKTTFPVVTALLLASGLWAAPAAAQNREHQQMAAELRMLQEQNQQLALALQQLVQSIQAVNARIDETNLSMKTAAANHDQSLKNMGTDLSVIRERTQESTTQFGRLRDEVDALQKTVAALVGTLQSGAAAPVDPNAPAGAAPLPSMLPPSDAQAAQSPSTLGQSPNRMLEAAKTDYFVGQYTLAISGFQQVIDAFSGTGAAIEAQFWIGESYFGLNRWSDAVTAYNTLIQAAPQSTFAPEAYYKRGRAEESQGQLDAARASWEQVSTLFPDSTGAQLARQNLERINRSTPAR